MGRDPACSCVSSASAEVQVVAAVFAAAEARGDQKAGLWKRALWQLCIVAQSRPSDTLLDFLLDYDLGAACRLAGFSAVDPRGARVCAAVAHLGVLGGPVRTTAEGLAAFNNGDAAACGRTA